MKTCRLWKKTLALILALTLMTLSGVTGTLADAGLDVTELYKKKDADGDWDTAGAVTITLGSGGAAVSDPSAAQADGDTLRITAAGDYVISGEWTGSIVIEAGTGDTVRLMLNGLTVTAAQGPAIYEKTADKLVVTLAEGSVNSLTAGTPVTDGDDTVGAALYAEDDLSINGAGALTAVSAEGHGIQSKADLIIAGGTLSVTAEKDGIRGRNSVLILDGAISVTAQGDGVTSTRSDKEGKGWIVIAGGELRVVTGSGAGETAAVSRNGGMRGGWGSWGAQTASGASDGVSRKGVKAETDLTILGGTLILDTEDDGLHADSILVSGGGLSIASGDDAAHADTSLTVSGGSVLVSQCFEGLEAGSVTISGGEVHITASDDGINTAGGSDASDTGWGSFAGREGDDGSMLTISGGTVWVSAGCDAIDSNGSFSMTGGTVFLYAATTAGDGAVDFNGQGSLTGGTLVITSTGGVMQDAAAMSGLPKMSVSAGGRAGSAITVLDGSGRTLASFTAASAYDTILIASDGLNTGDQVTIQADGSNLYSGEMTGSVSTGGFGGRGMPGGGQGGQGFGGGQGGGQGFGGGQGGGRRR